ncbi:uncharacterized protein VICG_00101 [Vittaforma corneae ATCC 50505]|uniref:Uncharacterized protein n=1 Tax=Vittaforma corneae (strain ATCC 50505) TaxID=993615 RepID=L2GPM3_VITCO|nr:uncharacterized protein VICG_00101 [Vittaforma corneae ATCC 50505]ELA42786.1 hypothetical protein VICG_00101 [Vittaforma corneae ATCC 50505]
MFWIFESSYKSLLNGHSLIPDDVRYYILELCMSQLFSRIGLLKMNSQISMQLVGEMKSLESTLKAQFDSIPYFKVIMDYLKIFAFPVEPKEDFIKNFNTISAGRFEFTQILKALDDQRLAMKMYEAFKKINQ